MLPRSRRVRGADGVDSGGEPLLHPQIGKIVAGLVARKKYVYMCTNALLLKRTSPVQAQQVPDILGPRGWRARAPRFFSLPGRRIRSGHRGYEGSAAARLPRDDEHHVVRWRRSQQRSRTLFDQYDGARSGGHDASPGYSYDKAPDQKHFLGRARTRARPSGSSSSCCRSSTTWSGRSRRLRATTRASSETE